MTEARRPTPPVDDLLDTALARSVRHAARADLRARVMASVAQGQPRGARPVAIWTAVAAAAVVTVVIAAQAMRRPVAPSAAHETPAASAPPTFRAPEPTADTRAVARRVAAWGTARPAASIASRAPGPHLAPRHPEADELTPLLIDPLEHPASPIVPLHTDDLAIVPLAIDDVGSLSSEDRP